MNALGLTTADKVRFLQEFWGPMLGLDLSPVNGPPPGVEDCIVATVQITGAWRGSVSVTLPRPLARTVASAFFGAPAEEVTAEQQRECAGEVANIIGGNIKAVAPSPSQLSLPAVSDGVGSDEVTGERVVLETVLESQGERFVIAVREAVGD